MEQKVKAAVVGLGVGMAHAKGYLACPDTDLYAICDSDTVRLQERGDELNIPLERRFSAIDQLLALPELDAISIGLPNFLHAPTAIAAFKAGKHVLCEKPLATSALEAQAMVDAAHKAGKYLMVCFNYRFREDARWLKSLQEEGKFGNLYFAKAGWLRNIGIPGRGWFIQKKLSGGGPLIDLGVHVLDLTLWLMGYPKVVSVSGTTFAEFGPRGKKTWGKMSGDTVYDVEDLAAGFVRFDNGTSLLLETSWASHTKPGRDDFFVTLYGSEGGSDLYVANYTDRDTVNFYTETKNKAVKIKPPSRVMKAGGHEMAVAHFAECIQQGHAPEASGEQGLTLMRLIDGIYESARTGREIRYD